MARKVAGFTLIEILFALALLGILIGIAIPSFTDWQVERQLVSDVKKVLSFVQKERAKAYSTKQNIVLTVDGTDNICDNVGDCVHMHHAFQANSTNITISSRGIYDDEHIRIQDDALRQEYKPKYSCIDLTSTRARLGKYDGSNCNAQ